MNNKKLFKNYFDSWREVIADASLSRVELALMFYLQQTNFEKPIFAYETLAERVGLSKLCYQAKKNAIWRAVKNLVKKNYLVKTLVTREKASPLAQLEVADRLKKPEGLGAIQGYVVGVEERLPASRRGAYSEERNHGRLRGVITGDYGASSNPMDKMENINNEDINNEFASQIPHEVNIDKLKEEYTTTESAQTWPRQQSLSQTIGQDAQTTHNVTESVSTFPYEWYRDLFQLANEQDGLRNVFEEEANYGLPYEDYSLDENGNPVKDLYKNVPYQLGQMKKIFQMGYSPEDVKEFFSQNRELINGGNPHWDFRDIYNAITESV